MFIDRRKYERESTDVPAKYIHHNHEFDCVIINISEGGVGMRLIITGSLSRNNIIKLVLSNASYACKVVYVDNTDVGVEFETPIPKEEVDNILSMSKKD